MDTSKVNINELIDKAHFTSFHWKVLIWCLLIIIFDGYDLVIYGVALPLLMQGEFKHEVRQFEKSYDNQQAEQISLMV
ncbi:hypothetical protein ABTP59_15435, partial [Acinetobacter baumannii]